MIGIKIRMPKNCQTCKLSMSSIGDSFYEDCQCIVKEETTKYAFGSKKGRPDYCPLQQLSIEEKMTNAKESHLFDGLSEEDKFEAVLAGKLAVALIKELEKIEADIKEEQLPRDNPYNKQTEYSVSMDEIRKIFDKHMSSIKLQVALIKELEKIRQESIKLTESNIMEIGTRADGRMDIIDIIDKQLSKLKGDKK